MSDWTEASVREASKIEWLEKQPDKFKDTPQGRSAFHILKGMVERNPKADGLAPWIWREAKKGRLVAKNYGDQSYFIYNEANQPGGLILNPSGLSHLADWFHSGNQNPTRRGVDIMQLTADDMESKLGEWDAHLRAKQEQADQDKLKGGDVVHQYPDGWTLRNLKPEDLDAEGDAMGHCVGGYGYQDMVRRGERQIYSLRDPQHQPHATMELEPDEPRREHEYAYENLAVEKGLAQDPAARQLPPQVKDAIRSMSSGSELNVDHEWLAENGYDHNALQGLYDSLKARYMPKYHTGPENALLHQIQGKGNEVPKPEYQARLKQFFETMPPEHRPTWANPQFPIQHIGEITGEDEDGGQWEPEEDMGGYGEHGDYGLGEGKPRPTQYDSVIDSLHERAENRGKWGRRGAYHDPADTEALYNHALQHQEIPELAAATQRYNDQTAQPSLMDVEDQNWEYLNYPGEEFEEDPERWDHDPQKFKDAQAEYDWNRNDLASNHFPSQIASDLLDRLNPHFYNNAFRNDLRPQQQQAFSHVPEQHLHREPDWTGFSAVDYLEDNRYRKRAIS